MKTIVSIILFVAVGIAAYYYQSTAETAATERDSALAKVLHLEEQHDKLTKDLKDRDKELAAALARVVELEEAAKPVAAGGGVESRGTDAAGGGVEIRGTRVEMVPAVPAADPMAEKRAKRLAEIGQEIAVLEAEQTRGEAARANAVANPPTFAEQGDRVDGAGRVIGKKGVRTSDADRAKAMEIHHARIAAMDARLAEIQAKLAELRREAGGIGNR